MGQTQILVEKSLCGNGTAGIQTEIVGEAGKSYVRVDEINGDESKECTYWNERLPIWD